MDKRYFVELTSKLYRLTFFFPAKEPLRNKIREVADETLAKLVLILEGEIEQRREAAFSVERNIEMLDVLLELSKSQNWIETEEIERIQKNYGSIQREVKEFNDITRRQLAKEGGLYQKEKLLTPSNEKKEKTPEKRIREKETIKKEERKEEKVIKLNERQEKIIKLLKEKDKMQA